MATNYSRFMMRPPMKGQLAQRLLGARDRTSGVAVTVRKSAAPEVFFRRALAARNTLTQPGMDPYPLGAHDGLSGLGALGAMNAKYTLVLDVGFNEAWSNDDYFNAPEWMKRHGYEGPVSETVLNRANQKAVELKNAADMGNTAAEQQLNLLLGTLSAQADAMDKHTKTRGAFGYGEAGDKRRAQIANAINRAIKAIANFQVPAAPQPPAPPPQTYQPPPQTYQPPPQTYQPPPRDFSFRRERGGGGGAGGGAGDGGGGSAGGGGVDAPMSTSTGASTGVSTPPKRGIPKAALALGAIAVLGVGVWLVKRKKK
jgi:uncharacterized membrane protein YgcG